MYGVIFACISKINQTGCFFGKLIKLAQKEENLGSFGGKVQKNWEKKSKFNKII